MMKVNNNNNNNYTTCYYGNNIHTGMLRYRSKSHM